MVSSYLLKWLKSMTCIATKFRFLIIVLSVTIISASDSDDDSEQELPTTTTEVAEEEWHMDYMPTGYLPDSVYRELAWYGILQIQPLYHSQKLKEAARLIWQHTINRPHVIMENPPQPIPNPPKVSRQVLAEEAARWSREQRVAQELLMENIKSGGNGLTVRTVTSSNGTTSYIIQNGYYYKCPRGSEPDYDSYRDPINIHDRKCTGSGESVQIDMDPCMEAETAPIEYSFHEGWMFCLGPGERDNTYYKNGTLDCGNKTKITVEEFLSLCAIDNNIVIKLEYYGDEPRKDLLHNTSICINWDPCEVSYLYRLEPPPVELTPNFPTTTQDPCDTTICEDCYEDSSKDGISIDIDSDDEDKDQSKSTDMPDSTTPEDGTSPSGTEPDDDDSSTVTGTGSEGTETGASGETGESTVSTASGATEETSSAVSTTTPSALRGRGRGKG